MNKPPVELESSDQSSDKKKTENNLNIDHHWADKIASRIIRQKNNQDLFTLASGITPSGTVHVGNFREVITVDLVKRALEKKGKKVRFIFSWDDFDVFRKVPENMPQKEKLKTFLGKSITQVPDPFEKYNSYAEYHEKTFESNLHEVGVSPEFIYQSNKYHNLDYVEGIRLALNKKEEIKVILNQFRKTPLDEKWYPISIFCGKCGNNKTIIIKNIGDIVVYCCNKCKHQEEINITKANHLKLLWRIDWPMRWAYEKVDFEPGGKDHSSEGGSYDTAKTISETIYKFSPPIYAPYDFVSIKGKNGKMSSSTGDVITLEEVLEIYEPEIIRWIFASYRNNVEFSIAFDLDVIKNYEAFDRLERIFFGLEESSVKQNKKLKRIYQLSQIETEEIKEIPFRAGFRHLTNIIQIYNFNLEKIKKIYEKYLKNQNDIEKFEKRVQCASNWIKKHAPKEFVFSLNNSKIHGIVEEYEEKYQKAFKEFGFFVKTNFSNLDEDKITEYIYELLKVNDLEAKIFYEIVYLMLINKKKGPKLVNFMKTINHEKLFALIG